MPATGSSSISSRTSTSSSTSDARPSRARALRRHLLLLRLVHPFPSILDGAATTAIAAAAGGAPGAALRLGVAMTLLQFGIGAANDAADASADLRRPEKPVTSGVVTVRGAAVVAVGCAMAGLSLATPSGPVPVVIALAGLGLGLWYDLRLKRTPLAWLPFAIGIPLLVMFAFTGAGVAFEGPVALVLPAGALAGAALALGNGLVDPEADAATGLTTPVVALGGPRARRLAVVLVVATDAIADGSLLLVGAATVWVFGALAAGGIASGGLLLAWHPARDRRERGWEVEAVGIALLGAAWIAGLVSARP